MASLIRYFPNAASTGVAEAPRPRTIRSFRMSPSRTLGGMLGSTMAVTPDGVMKLTHSRP